MKLTFRGHFYETSAPIQLTSDSTDQPKLKLIYRGSTFDYNPRPLVVFEEVETDESTTTLIYRGNTYERIERIGYLGYKLYRLGWQNAVHKNLNPIEHLLFNALLYYRRGFKESFAYIKANNLEEIRH